jgi:hypothetical protein
MPCGSIQVGNASPFKETFPHDLEFEDAKFMLVACPAFINYLKAKASNNGSEARPEPTVIP